MSVHASDGPDVVRIADVTKRFVLRKDNSLKERLVTLGRAGRRHREDFWALDGVSATIQAGHTVALIGHNGSGKSTLLKVIGGIIDPTSGSVERRGRIAALLELGAGFHPDLTGRENVFLNASIMGLSRAETEQRFEDILDFSGIGEFIDSQVKFYSSGMYVRLAFAVAVHTDPDLLLVDEVLAVGDEAFQRKCLDKIRSFQNEGRTIVLVTHTLSQVTELCDRAILLNAGKVDYDGEPREAVARFRDILEDRRVSSIHGDDSSEKPREAIIHGAIASAVGRGPADDVHLGDDLEIEVDFEFLRPTDDWLVAIQIDTSLGQVIYGTTTRRMGLQLPPADGRRTAKFVLEDLRFGAGKYFVNVSLMDHSGRHIVDLAQACAFDAAGDDLAVGASYARPAFVDLGPAA
ncbi:ABC-2 type transport system ATP-binding protein [Agromyces sp. 3263]|uniref:ABC transporter ATP-binding protein n=1 Tax=Agromyces sp. 3263 TaxID=2817750 RepID=UPI00285A2A9D|nr:ABC transporter ATP-binding protein [Agromyces sp. 3263]MDR6904651.1 ABC-2 type transport system ATP-binding protein [Agromyces sp. 3263]